MRSPDRFGSGPGATAVAYAKFSRLRFDPWLCHPMAVVRIRTGQRTAGLDALSPALDARLGAHIAESSFGLDSIGFASGGVDSDVRCNPVDSIGSSTENRVSHSEPRLLLGFRRDKDGSARRNIEPIQ